MKNKAFRLFFFTVIPCSILLTVLPAAGEEDPVRCECFYRGYDTKAQPNNANMSCDDVDPLDAVDCDLIHKKEYWKDGCKYKRDGKQRLCPYEK